MRAREAKTATFFCGPGRCGQSVMTGPGKDPTPKGVRPGQGRCSCPPWPARLSVNRDEAACGVDGRRYLCGAQTVEQVERAAHAGDALPRDVRVSHGRFQALMAE